MCTPAHTLSKSRRIDPQYSSGTLTPAPVALSGQPQWLYGAAEFEAFYLAKMRIDVKNAELNVGYPGVFHEAEKNGCFHTSVRPGTLRFRANGAIRLSLNQQPGMDFPASENIHEFSTDKGGELRLDVSAGDVPCVLPLQGFDSCVWTFSGPDGISQETSSFPQSVTAEPPHLQRRPVIEIPVLRGADGLYDAGCELYGHVELRHAGPLRPALFAGENRNEARNTDPSHFEQSPALEQRADGVWRSKHPLAFRYLLIQSAGPETQVVCEAQFTPAIYRGAFAAGPRDNDIWMRSAYTIRMCTDHFLLDGIKRDHLPWAGDLRVSLLSTAFAFGDPFYVRETLAVLGRAGIRASHVNGIIDYSLWLIMCHDTYQQYFDDFSFLRREYPRIKDMFDVLAGQEDASGFLRVEQWLFIDWLEMQKTTALQVMYIAALKAGASLARRMQDSAFADSLLDKAAKRKTVLFDRAFDSESGLFRSEPDAHKPVTFTRHPNFLALLFDVVEGDVADRIADRLAADDLPPAGTPFMAAMEIAALTRHGRRQAALNRLRTIWGAMLDDGATTFYEAFNPDAPESKRYEFYGRPYALSCCHAWSAAPAYLLPQLAFDVQPLSDGWRTFSARDTGLFRNAHAAVPTPRGVIELNLEDGVLTVKSPAGVQRIF